MNGLSKIFVRIARNLLGYFDVGVTKMSTLNRLAWRYQDYDHLSAAINFLDHVAEKNLRKAINIVGSSKSQLHQDIFVLVALDFKRNGFFVEFGATNGVVDSNSWLLENKFGWEGIVAEPGKRWQKQLKNNRHCQISNKCVWKNSGDKILFNETKDEGFSTIDAFSSADIHSKSRNNGTKYFVETLSLDDLLISFDAPNQIDYLSIDTEGSEFEILAAFDFGKWDISIITVEHNYSNNREK